MTVTAACARPRVAVAPQPAVGASTATVAMAEAPASCRGCTAVPFGDEVIRAVSRRVADLTARGGACAAYASVLEQSLASQRIVVRPFMWRVGTNLASAQALSTGEIDVAREIDALNVGVRSLDDVVHSVEHEAAHIAFAIPSGQRWTEMIVDERVGECRSRSTGVGAMP